MDVSSPKWLSELGLDEYSIIHQCHMNSLAELTTVEDIATALGGSFQQSFSSESYSSYPNFNPKSTTTTFSGSSIENSHERPTKQLKTSSWNSDNVSPKPSSTSQILSFENLSSTPSNPHEQKLYGSLISCTTVKPCKEEGLVSPEAMQLPRVLANGSYGNHAPKANQGIKRASSMTRTPSHAQDHIMAERKRREKLSQRFIALSAIVPGLKKMDKASVLGDAIKYVKQLQERIQVLEEQTKKRTVESVVLVKRSQLSADDDSSSCDENFDGQSDAALPEIEARVSDKDVLIRVHCEKQKGPVVKILSEVEKLHLSIINSNVLPFGNSTLDITIIAQKDDEFDMTAKDLAKDLRLTLLKFM